MPNVVKFYPKDASKDPNVVLEAAIDAYLDVIIIGWNKENMLEIRATKDLKTSDVLLLLELFKSKLLAGDYGRAME